MPPPKGLTQHQPKRQTLWTGVECYAHNLHGDMWQVHQLPFRGREREREREREKERERERKTERERERKRERVSEREKERERA